MNTTFTYVRGDLVVRICRATVQAAQWELTRLYPGRSHTFTLVCMGV